MEAEASLALPAPKQFEMQYARFKMSTIDLPVELLKKISMTEVWCILQYEVQRQCLMFQYSNNYITGVQFTSEIENLENVFLDDKLKKLREEYGI